MPRGFTSRLHEGGIAMLSSLGLHMGMGIWAWQWEGVQIVPPSLQAIEVVMVAAPTLPEPILPEPEVKAEHAIHQASPPTVKKTQHVLAPKPKPSIIAKPIAQTSEANDRPHLPMSHPRPAMALPAAKTISRTIHSDALTAPQFNAAYLRNPSPTYPAAARRRGVEGTVLLRVEVSAKGNAKSVKLQRSSGSMLLDNAAHHAVQLWRFIPAKRGGLAIGAHVTVPVVFALRKK
jgi:periplasmic protein TonB